MRRPPTTHVTSAVGSSRARSSIDRGRSANAAGPASNVPCLWHGHSCRASQRLRDATSLRIRDARPPCCARLSWEFFSLLADECRLVPTWLPTEASTTGQRQWNKEKATLPLFDRTSAAESSRPRTDEIKFARDTQKASCDRNNDQHLDVAQRGGPIFRNRMAAWLRWILGSITPPISPGLPA
jgi:hypothetical protein